MSQKHYNSIVTKIRGLLIGALAIPLVITLISVAASFYTNLSYKNVVNQEMKVRQLTSNLVRYTGSVRLSMMEFAAGGLKSDPVNSLKSFEFNYNRDAKKLRKDAERLMEILPRVSYGEEALKRLQVSLDAFNSYEQSCQIIFDNVFANLSRPFLETNLYINTALYNDRENMYSFEGNLLAIDSMSEESIQNSLKDISRKSQLFSLGTTVAFVLVVLIIIILIFITLSRMKKNVKEIVFQVKDLARGEGDLTKILPIVTRDEFGELSEYMNKFISNLKTMVLQLKQTINEGFDVSQNLMESSTSTAESLDRINKRITDIQEMSDRFSDESEEVISHFEKVETFIGEVNQLIDNQAADIEESSSAIAEMTSSINNVQGSMNIKVQLADELKRVAQEGQTKMTGTMEDIHTISQAAQSILDMVKMINKIASQTNLLAMNAAIEAAHAGDAGKGFSVVADEIRKLSEDTTVNAKSINKELSGIVSVIQVTDEAAGETSESFKVIVERIGIVADGIREMGQTLTEISLGNSQINQSLSSLVDSAGSLKNSSTEMNSMMENIGSLLKDINSLSGRTSSGVSDISLQLSDIQKGGQISADAGVKNSKLFKDLEEMGQQFKVRSPEQ